MLQAVQRIIQVADTFIDHEYWKDCANGGIAIFFSQWEREVNWLSGQSLHVYREELFCIAINYIQFAELEIEVSERLEFTHGIRIR